MYNAWAAYDATAVGYVVNEKISPLPRCPGIEPATRRSAMPPTACCVPGFSHGNGWAVTEPALDAKLTEFGYSPAIAQGATNATSPADSANASAAILTWGVSDGFSNTTYPQSYTDVINPNMLPARPLSCWATTANSPPAATCSSASASP